MYDYRTLQESTTSYYKTKLGRMTGYVVFYKNAILGVKYDVFSGKIWPTDETFGQAKFQTFIEDFSEHEINGKSGQVTNIISSYAESRDDFGTGTLTGRLTDSLELSERFLGTETILCRLLYINIIAMSRSFQNYALEFL